MPTYPDLETYRKLFADRFGALLGCEMKAISPDECVYELEIRPDHWNPNETAHGGALFGAMDSCQGALVHYTLDWEKQLGTTAEATIRYKQPVRDGLVRIVTTIPKRNRKVWLVRTEAFDQHGNLLAYLDEKWMILNRPS